MALDAVFLQEGPVFLVDARLRRRTESQGGEEGEEGESTQGHVGLWQDDVRMSRCQPDLPATLLKSARLFPGFPDDPLPLVGHQLVAAVGGVDAVPDPVIVGGLGGSVIEEFLEADEGSAMFEG